MPLTDEHAPATAQPVNQETHEEGHVHGLAHHFEDLDQQREAGELGMWLFLITEFMFFGGFLMAYLVFRHWYPEAFSVGSGHMDLLLGTINTAVLLTSSLTMALAVHASHTGQKRDLPAMLLATMVLGAVFLGIKGYEYYHKFHDHLIPFGGLTFAPEHPVEGLAEFYNIYFLTTGLHAFHMVLGLVILGVLVVMARRGDLTGPRSIIVHNVGLYWHFVDLVWVYLFPFFYLAAISK